jgi:hypothetical protein
MIDFGRVDYSGLVRWALPSRSLSAGADSYPAITVRYTRKKFCESGC